MRAKPFLALFFLFISAASNIAKATNTTPLLSIEHWTTKNGIPVYFVAKPQIPIIDIGVVFRAGSAYDGSAPGIAQFTAQMLNQGTRNLNANEIANHFESVGAQYSASTNQDRSVFQLRSLSKVQFFNSAFNTFIELIGHANFPQTAISRIQKQSLIAIQQEAQTPTAIARKTFYQTLYGEHPYALPVLGTTQSIEQITQKKLINFYQHYYVAKNAVIAIVGNMTKEKAANIAEQLASALPQGNVALPLPIPLSHANNLVRKIHYPSQQSTILLGEIGITLQDPDYFPLLLGNQILGGGVLTSQLFSEVRNKRGLCYGITSRFITLQAGGPFIIALQTRSTQAATALSLTQKLLKNFVVQGPTDSELNAAKQALIGSFPLTIANNQTILTTLEEIGFYDLPLTYLDNYQAKLSQVDTTQIRTAFQKHITPKKLLVVMVGQN